MMIQSIATNELAAFHEFVGAQVNRAAQLTPEEAVEAFRVYQNDLARFHKESRAAAEEIENGLTTPLDVAALKRRVREQLAARGITE
jgi:hypothetical protein